MNITSEQELDIKELEHYLRPFGVLEQIKPIKMTKVAKNSKPSLILSLYSNSSLKDEKFVKYCTVHNIVLQMNLFEYE